MFISHPYVFFREGNGTPLQYFCLKSPMDGGAWKAAGHGVAESWTRLSDFTFTFHFHEEKEMATHSGVLAWRIPGTGEPGGLPSMGPHRVRHDWSDLAITCLLWRNHHGLYHFILPSIPCLTFIIFFEHSFIWVDSLKANLTP